MPSHPSYKLMLTGGCKGFGKNSKFLTFLMELFIIFDKFSNELARGFNRRRN